MNDSRVEERHLWQVLDSYFRQNGLVKQQIDSYNRFTFDMEQVVTEYGNFIIPVKHQFRAGEDFNE
jgi:DNA-directed RNA polymerase beta subunit